MKETLLNPILASESEKLFEATFASLTEAIFILQGDPATIVRCNPAAERMFGYQEVDLLGQTTDILHVNQAELARFREKLFSSIQEVGKLQHFEFHMRRANGQIFPTEHSVAPLIDRQGNRIGWISIITDISSRKETEVFSQQRTRELKALYEISIDIIREKSLDTLLKAIVKRAADLVRVPIAGLYQAIPEKKVLELVVSNYLPDSKLGIQIGFGMGLSGKVYETGQPMAIEDYQTWEDREESFQDYPFRKMMSVPVRTSHGIWGVLNLTSDQEAGAFSRDDIHLISLFADQAAIAIEKANLIEIEKKRNEELARSNALMAALSSAASALNLTLQPQEVIQTVGNELKKLGMTIQIFEYEPLSGHLVFRYTSIPSAALKWIEKSTGVRLLDYSIPLNLPALPGLAIPQKVLFDRHPLPSLINAFQWANPQTLVSFLKKIGITDHTPILHLPLAVKDHMLGMISIWGPDLREEDVAAYMVFAAQVSTALENTRLYNEIKLLATTDELTGVLNRRGFFAMAESHMRIALRKQLPITFIFVDIDDFKQINDRWGHHEGDAALAATAALFRRTFRTTDLVARMGGDEFAILAFDAPPNAVERMLERLALNLQQLNYSSGKPYQIQLSIGISSWSPDQPIEIDHIITEADEHMYEHKRSKKKLSGC